MGVTRFIEMKSGLAMPNCWFYLTPRFFADIRHRSEGAPRSVFAPLGELYRNRANSVSLRRKDS